ncbi:hypothetical protein BC832DRAFT_591829 [Gaertneriomyces semiglobifer]|nr:hypothetical protein BC832DRAFT_591829 [Gaertneriomyces semiglobifer]
MQPRQSHLRKERDFTQRPFSNFSTSYDEESHTSRAARSKPHNAVSSEKVLGLESPPPSQIFPSHPPWGMTGSEKQHQRIVGQRKRQGPPQLTFVHSTMDDVAEQIRKEESQPKKRRAKTQDWQREILMRIFDTETVMPGPERRQEIAAMVCMQPRTVQVWFQNRRAKFRAAGKDRTPTSRETSPQPEHTARVLASSSSSAVNRPANQASQILPQRCSNQHFDETPAAHDSSLEAMFYDPPGCFSTHDPIQKTTLEAQSDIDPDTLLALQSGGDEHMVQSLQGASSFPTRPTPGTTSELEYALYNKGYGSQ